MQENNTITIEARHVDILNREIRASRISILSGRIADIQPVDPTTADALPYAIPGFVDAHVHIESSMLIPSEFARLAVTHGTVATVSDPHEIANVCGEDGVLFMIENGKQVPFKFNFGAPSCVPATTFETAGASLDMQVVTRLLQRDDIKYLSEMMNFPGVLFGDKEVMGKIEAARSLGKPIDGHAPGLRGEQAKQYVGAGISTDHECFTYEEALEKLQLGMKIIIREGSAAKNFEALIPLIDDWSGSIMFCSDDKHPDSLVEGHINKLCARAVAKGHDVFNVLRAACIDPVEHYRLDVGLLKVGDPADLILVKDLVQFDVLQTYINGVLVASGGRSLIERTDGSDALQYNQFDCEQVFAKDLEVVWKGQPSIPLIEALDGQLITRRVEAVPEVSDGNMVPSPDGDILKIAVINRYHKAKPAVWFIKNFGLKVGAIASTVAHDSHNIVVVGCDDESIARAANLVIQCRGGVSATDLSTDMVLPLPVAGLMSADDGYDVANAYTAIDRFSKEILGSTLASPFMTLSFMALLVIPSLKRSDKGLFDGDSFKFVS